MINKIYVDSRFAVNGESTSNFEIELPESVKVDDNIAALLLDCSIPHTWFNVSERNNRFFYRVYAQLQTAAANQFPPAQYDLVSTIPEQNYSISTLATNLMTSMNHDIAAVLDDVRPKNNILVRASANDEQGTVVLSLNTLGMPLFTSIKIKVFSNSELVGLSDWRGDFFNPRNIRSLNDVLRNTGKQFGANLLTVDTTWSSGFVDLLGNHNIYINCNELSTFQNIGPQGERNILKKIMVDKGFGDVIQDKTYLEQDATNVSNTLLKRLTFTLTDVYGNVLDLNGAHISFTICFTHGSRY